MNKTLRKSLRTALTFAAIGAAVATAMPFVMGALAGMHLLAASSVGALSVLSLAGVAHTTGVFGLFGLLVPPMELLADKAFGKEPPLEPTAAKTHPAAEISPTQEQELSTAASKFRDQLAAERTAQSQLSR